MKSPSEQVQKNLIRRPLMFKKGGGGVTVKVRFGGPTGWWSFNPNDEGGNPPELTVNRRTNRHREKLKREVTTQCHNLIKRLKRIEPVKTAGRRLNDGGGV